MERTYESTTALGAAGPVASHLGPFVTSLIDQQYTASVIYLSTESLVGIGPTTSFSPCSEACDNTDYVAAS